MPRPNPTAIRLDRIGGPIVELLDKTQALIVDSFPSDRRVGTDEPYAHELLAFICSVDAFRDAALTTVASIRDVESIAAMTARASGLAERYLDVDRTLKSLEGRAGSGSPDTLPDRSPGSGLAVARFQHRAATIVLRATEVLLSHCGVRLAVQEIDRMQAFGSDSRRTETG